jgi:phenylacetate-CoA ligase
LITSLLNKMRLLNHNKKMTPADLQKLQRKKFENLITYALDHSPFYYAYYRQHGIKKEHIKSLKITDLPLTNKQMLMENFDRVICDTRLSLKSIENFVSRPENLLQPYPGQYTVLHSSGTSGKVGYFVYSKDEWEYAPALAASRMESPFSHIFQRGKLIGFVAADGNFGGVSMLTSFPDFLYDKLIIPINTPVSEIIRKINSFPGAEIITGYAAAIFQLAKLKIAGQIKQHPRLITTSAEALTPMMRSVIKEAFGVYPRDFYAASESICMGGECRFTTGIHLFTDCHIFELVDETQRPVSENMAGHVVVTNLYKKTQPLIRYELNDILSMDHTPCQCGSPFPRIKKIEGRESVVLEFSKDNLKGTIHHSLLKELSVPGLQNIQYIQQDPGRLLVNAVISGNQQEAERNIARKIDAILQSCGLEFVNYSMAFFDNIPVNPKTNKLETVICYKPGR